ncbi:hypothetical protein NMY22_g8966 [Coprinellus aureogranulatus]|nr:hypothetical protein NMY22_g8966 [Coprinellus aureogranulatus]
MDISLFRKKGRPRQSSGSGQDLGGSIPYDKVATSPRSPVPVATISQGLRGISAPNTNPGLTPEGTTLNKFTMQRNERPHDYYPGVPSPVKRQISEDSSLYDDSTSANTSTMSIPKSALHNQAGRLRNSEASSSSQRNSGYGEFNGSYSSHPYATAGSSRPASSANTPRSDHKRVSSAASLASNDSGSHHRFHASSLYHKLHHGDSFHFPRPETDSEIEELYEVVARARSLNLPGLTIDQKWDIVYNDHQIRWKNERVMEESMKKQHDNGQPGTIIPETPEWYIKKFLDKTITAKQASGLSVSLRSKELSWFKHFLAIQGTSVLAQTLMHISRKGNARRDSDISLEYEVVKCLRDILNQSKGGEALNHHLVVSQLASSLNTSNIPTRRLVLEMLCFLVYRNEGLNLVLTGLEALSAANNEPNDPYAFWFKSLELSLSGRGKMGSLVGASEEVRRAGGLESSLNDYALANLLLINAILTFIDDLELRLHHRSQMYTNGLQRILELCASFGVPTIDGHIKQINGILQEDAAKLQERLDQQILKDLENPQDVFNAISAKTQGTKAHDYFLSMMQHMLLIREDGQPLVHYYQLLDSIVTDVVMDKKLAGAEQRLGYSVERIIAQFNEADRYIKVEDEANEARAMAMRLKLEKEALEEELAQGADGLLSRLKSQVAQGEEKLRASRDTVSRLQKQLEAQKAEYEERIAQLEQQILELFRMLKEVGKEGVDAVVAADGAVMDRKALVEQLERNFQRHKTISILEGRKGKGSRRKNKSKFGDDSGSGSDSDDADATPVKGSLRRSRAIGSKKSKAAQPNGVRTTVIDENGRVSQFMDADEDDAQEQVQQQLAAGVKLYSPKIGSSSRSIRGSPRRTDRPTLGSETSKGGNLQAPRFEDGASISMDSRSSSPVIDDESEFGRSIRSGTDDTAFTSAAVSTHSPMPSATTS